MLILKFDQFCLPCGYRVKIYLRIANSVGSDQTASSAMFHRNLNSLMVWFRDSLIFNDSQKKKNKKKQQTNKQKNKTKKKKKKKKKKNRP